MERVERIVLLHRLFSEMREGMTVEYMMQIGECSRPTLYRDLEYLRDELHAPLEHDGGMPRNYRYELGAGTSFQLPGMWLGADQLYGLRLAQMIFEQSGAEFLEQKVSTMQVSARKVLARNAEELRRLRIVRSRARKVRPEAFRAVAQATFERCQLTFDYQSRSSGNTGERRVSPQLLTHYRDNWYLDAWDPASDRLLTFSIDRIRDPAVLHDQPASNRPEAELAAHQNDSYGIFTGPATAHARILFTPHAASWVQDEHWHDQQHQHLHPDGSLELILPYADPRELIMDILRFGKDAVILGPKALRQQMVQELAAASGRYGERG